MAEIKTVKNDSNVLDFINRVEDETKKQDSLLLLKIFEDCTGEKATMWGSSIIGFGKYHYKYATGREGDTVAVGFSPRKSSLVLYGIVFYDYNRHKIDALGPVTVGKGCLYIKSLSTIDLDALGKMITTAFNERNGHE